MQHPALDIDQTAPAAHRALGGLIAAYDAEIAARRASLQDDLSAFRARLCHLQQLDPLDFTGLQEIYRAHVRHAARLLEEFDDAGTPPPAASSAP